MERINYEGKLKLNEPFSPFVESDLAILDQGDHGIQKCFTVEGVVGELHLNVTKMVPWDFGDFDFAGGRLVSPYSAEPLTKKNIADYLIHVSMCFNNTADVSPSFKLMFPDAVKPTFYAFVCDWDTGGDLKDATQYEFEEGDLETEVDLQLPDDHNVLLVMKMEVMDRFWHYPDVAVNLSLF